ncbi:hypothetical protein STXM2123_3294 [Streptomyces sp. F-3]|nr:hypothetical protein STXM2123_3294 [Streptomyces sp. F-3]
MREHAGSRALPGAGGRRRQLGHRKNRTFPALRHGPGRETRQIPAREMNSPVKWGE